jgi:hypothetical protein
MLGSIGGTWPSEVCGCASDLIREVRRRSYSTSLANDDTATQSSCDVLGAESSPYIYDRRTVFLTSIISRELSASNVRVAEATYAMQPVPFQSNSR